MTRRKKIYYNAQQRTLIWDRYQQGDSLHDIGKMFERIAATNYRGQNKVKLFAM